jgi:hypothetical protein
MKTGVRETFAVVFAKEAALGQQDVVDLIATALAVQPVPLFVGHLTFP